jgi:ketosteroid isomerase-like protein
MVFDQFEPREFIAQGETVVCIGYYKARVPKTGGEMSSTWVMVFTVRNGRIARFREWTDSAQLNRAYGAVV